MPQQTIRLYDEAPYDKDFEACVLSCVQEVDDRYSLILDRTLFFPEEGGQTPDRGMLSVSNSQLDVLDVQITDGIIRHTVSSPVEAGSAVSGHIDWAHRYDNMRQHSGEHILSGLVHSMYGYDNVGFRLSDHEVTVDYNGKLTDDELAGLEMAACEAIADNLTIRAEYPSAEELSALSYRSKKAIDGPIRIVTILDEEHDTGRVVDCCACCAPHVRRTGEISLLKILSAQSYKGGVRLSIACGDRALAIFRQEHELLHSMGESLTTSIYNLPEQISRLRDENNSLKAALSRARTGLLTYEIAAIPADQRDVILFEPEGDMNVLRRMVDGLMTDRPGICAAFLGCDDAGYSYVLGSADGRAMDIQKLLAKRFGAKGGGSPRMVQGKVLGTDEKALRACLSSL